MCSVTLTASIQIALRQIFVRVLSCYDAIVVFLLRLRVTENRLVDIMGVMPRRGHSVR